MTDYTAEAGRASGPDTDDEPEIDTIEAVRASLANLRATWRHRNAKSIDRDLAHIDDRLAALAEPLDGADALVVLDAAGRQWSDGELVALLERLGVTEDYQ